MTAGVGTLTIHLADLPEVKAALEEARDLIERLRTENKDLTSRLEAWERATLDNSGDERRTETGVSTTGTIR